MPETAVAQHEALPSIETNPPSPALKARIAHGIFDETALPNMPLPEKVDQKAFDALHNQNVRQRQKDAAKFAAANQNPDLPLSPEVLRHNQMQAWSLGIWKEMNDLIDAKQEKVFAIFADPQKLGIPIKPNGNDMQELLKQFYDQSTQKEGSFYQKFCTGNMNEKLANALTLDDMMHLQTFLTKWMLGSDTAFNALVALKTTMDDLASSDPTSRQALSQHATTKVTGDLDNQILDFYQKGLQPKDEEKQPAQPTQPLAVEGEEEKKEQLEE